MLLWGGGSSELGEEADEEPRNNYVLVFSTSSAYYRILFLKIHEMM